MDINLKLLVMGVGGLVLAAGCGSQSSPATTSAPSQTVKTPSSSASTKANPSAAKQSTKVYCYQCSAFSGAANLAHYVNLAKANPTNEQDQYHAAEAENVNQHPQQALQYYEAAAKLAPKNGQLDNDMGNIYRIEGQLQTAVQYYQKATELTPSYDYGWYNWMLAEQKLGNTAKAKSVAQQAMKVLPTSDPLYQYLKKGS